jgi:hypothetical protein
VSAAPVPVAATAPVAQAAPAPEKPAETKAPPAPEPAAPAAPVVAATPAPTAPAVTESKPAASKPSRVETKEDMPEDVRVALEKAEKALVTGNAEDALDLARRSQNTKPTLASFSVMARAYCLKKDLSNARAQWRRLPVTKRGPVEKYCKLHEFPL